MGVTGLWTVVQPCARPIKIETLNKKRLAVDASIWIYQFLKAVRDKEGNALRNSHVVGFFRRICKLLFIGIKPVFVFDGGAPALKRQTISGRKARREGRREDAVRTAGKLLALQMQRRAEEDDEKRKRADLPASQRDEEDVPDNPVYAGEVGMTQKERDQNRKFKKKDQYHLPDLGTSLAEMGQPNDPRVMSLEELENYARQFDTGEDINIYDFSKIDFNSPFFKSLPAADRYNILNAARLRSRLRMGYSKDQLEDMFPDRMAFSRFQIERVKERNELTQRLMHLAGMTDDSMPGVEGTGRIAGEKGREYVLVKNAGVEGGWALGVIGDKDTGQRSKPIDVDMLDEKPKVEEEDSDEDLGFEDVPIEGLNRLPKISQPNYPKSKISTSDILRRRGGNYNARSPAAGRIPRIAHSAPSVPEPALDLEADSLFVQDTAPQELVIDAGDGEEEAELQKAIAMSLKKDESERESSPDDSDFEEVFQERRREPSAPFKNCTGSVTSIANKASQSAGVLSGPFQMDDEGSEEGEEILASTSAQPTNPCIDLQAPALNLDNTRPSATTSGQTPKFDGPLPFEKLDLGHSILGKKKMQKIEESQAGGFEKPQENMKKKAVPIPPWFNEGVEKSLEAQKAVEAEDRARERRAREEEDFFFETQPKLGKDKPSEVIDVDAIDDIKNDGAVIMIDSDDEDETRPLSRSIVIQDADLHMDDAANLIRAEPPEDTEPSEQPEMTVPDERYQASKRVELVDARPPRAADQSSAPASADDSDEEQADWEESDYEEVERVTNAARKSTTAPAGGLFQPPESRSPSVEFEDVDMTENVTDGDAVVSRHASYPLDGEQVEIEERLVRPPLVLLEVEKSQDAEPEPPRITVDSDDEQFFSSDEDDELMFQLAKEAEEHARFASQLNQDKSARQNIEEYERELKSLRSQQKKDRRDADEVTHVMVTECQQLLKLFGLPYITAPMEAEAQCAELVHLGLVDGIVTDDSDIFLFGGTRIYKNMFNQAKFVECYLQSDLEREFDLTREKMIRIAHLLGSDYTEGIPGIGPVTALEIISEFSTGLGEFKDWWNRVQRGISTTDEDGSSAFRRKFRKNITRLFLPNIFPDLRVDQAYLKPEVDSDPSAFQWGVPDLDALRSFLMATIGWSQERTDEVLVPVVRDMNRRIDEGTQANITAFLGGSVGAGAFAPRRRDGKSKRMETALEKLAARARAKKEGLIDEGSCRDSLLSEAVDGEANDADESIRSKEKRTASGKEKRKAARHNVHEDESDRDAPAKRKKPRKGRK